MEIFMSTKYSRLDFPIKGKILKSKRSQAWGIDLIIGLVIFTAGVLAFYIFTLNYSHENLVTGDMIYGGSNIADSLLSEGSPENWNSEDVIKIGLLSDGRINQTKLENFYSLSLQDYVETKRLFNTNDNYFFFLSEKIMINSEEIEGIGLKPENPENLFKITRFTIYNHKPITMSLYIWN